MATPMMKHRVAVLEADSTVRAALVAALQRDGHQVVSVETPGALAAALADHPVDVAVVDLGGGDGGGDGGGKALVRSLRAASAIGIVAISGSDDVLDRIIVLEMGADHILPRPVEPRELAVRVRTLLWRVAGTGNQGTSRDKSQYRFGDWLFDVEKRMLRHGDSAASSLTRQETAVLQALVSNAGKVMSRDQLMDSVNREWTPTDRTIDVLIGRLRRKIEPDPADPGLIITVFGEGYLFAAPVL